MQFASRLGWPGRQDVSSKEAVNRAGELLRRFFHTPRDPGVDVFDGFNSNEVIEAIYAVTWWKQPHAIPLSKVGANLRYHVMKEQGEVEGRIDVAQRLKKRDTIIDKLDRYPKMKLTRMHDIGGVRATLPSLPCLHAVSRRLRKTWTIAKTRDYIVDSEQPLPDGLQGELRARYEKIRDVLRPQTPRGPK